MYCPSCGNELKDDHKFCVHCGRKNDFYVEKEPFDKYANGQSNASYTADQQTAAQQPWTFPPYNPNANTTRHESEFATAAKVFLILSTIFMALFTHLISLAWCLPMTISYFRKVKNGEHVKVSFKICTLIFVSLIGGILMLCDKDN